MRSWARASAASLPRTRERREPSPNCFGQVLWRRGRARAEGYQAAGKREQILDAVIHLPEKEMLPPLGLLALANIPGAF